MKYLAPVAALALLTGLAACKPSEKNYRLAYETAQQKARAGLDEGVYEMMQAEELPPFMRSATDSVRALAAPVIWQYTPQAVDSGRRLDPAPYNLAVGKYKMLTNARGQADNLAAAGWRSCILRTGEPVYYVVAAQSSSLDSIAAEARRYAREYPRGVVALPCPVALIPSGR